MHDAEAAYLHYLGTVFKTSEVVYAVKTGLSSNSENGAVGVGRVAAGRRVAR